MHRFLKVIGGISAAIILGAIGSGVWEKALSPALSWLSATTASGIASVSTTYADSIYQRAARDATDLYPMRLSLVAMVLLGLALVTGIFFRTLSRFTVVDEHVRRRLNRAFNVQGLVMGLALILAAFVSMVRLDAASKIKESSLRSLEILRPYVGEPAYFRLRSDYYSIESKNDFAAFKATVLQQASRAARPVPLATLDR